MLYFFRNGINQLSGCYVQSLGKSQNHIEAWLPCAIFKRTDKRSDYIHPFTKLFLGKLFFKPVRS